MRQLVQRLSRVADSSSPPSLPETKRRPGVGRAGAAVPVHVGEERFLVRAELLGRPALAELLGRAALEYGYGNRGPLRIPCSPAAFRRALASLDDSGDDDG